MSILKQLLGIAPKAASDGSFSPSPLALRLATTQKTDYAPTQYPNAYQGGVWKVMMICTEERYMVMQNGKKFSTGNHPVEMLVPMLHLEQAGFEVDIYTPSGKAVKIEHWAMPAKDEAVHDIYQRYKAKFEQPASLQDFVQNEMQNNNSYMALFFPGGHGAMLGLPDNEDVGDLIYWAHQRDIYILAICHGPAALLSANRQADGNPFVFSGYKMAVFPDALDKKTPWMGYMPGHMPWYLGERLSTLGVDIINSNANGTCYHDRKLITGDSPNAANKFGHLAASALLKSVNASASMGS